MPLARMLRLRLVEPGGSERPTVEVQQSPPRCEYRSGQRDRALTGHGLSGTVIRPQVTPPSAQGGLSPAAPIRLYHWEME